MITEADFAAPQREAQRLLGRCLLRLQQYEKLLKTLIAQHRLDGPIEELEGRQTARNEAVASVTLGTLAKAFFESVIVSEGRPPTPPDDSWGSPTAILVDMRMHLALPEQQITQTKAALQELVSLRNELVHHLLERVDLWSLQGCQSAITYLSDSYAHIDLRFQELFTLAKQFDEARAETAKLMQSDVFLDFLADGIEPDGKVDWPRAGIVRALLAAFEQLAQDGAAHLGEATAWIAEQYPDQTPARYACRSWPQVLHESRQFDLTYRRDQSGTRRPWFCPRTKAPRTSRRLQ